MRNYKKSAPPHRTRIRRQQHLFLYQITYLHLKNNLRTSRKIDSIMLMFAPKTSVFTGILSTAALAIYFAHVGILLCKLVAAQADTPLPDRQPGTERIGIGPKLPQTHRLADDTFRQVLAFLTKTKHSQSAKPQQGYCCRLGNTGNSLNFSQGHGVIRDKDIV